MFPEIRRVAMRLSAVPAAVLVCACSAAAAGDEPTVGPDTSVTQTPSTSVTDTGPAASLEQAKASYYSGDYKRAFEALERIRVAAADGGVVHAEANALTWQGLTAWRQGKYDLSRELQEQAVALKLRHLLNDDLSRSYNALGLLEHDVGRYDVAIRRYEQAAAAAREIGNEYDVAKARANEALSLSQIGQLDRAREHFDSFRVAAIRQGELRTEANQLVNLGMLDIRVGQPQDALTKLDSARQLYRIEEHPVGEENALAQIGTAMNALGDPHRAIAYLDSALTIDSLHELWKEAAENLQLKAEIFGQLGDHDRALALLDKAHSIASELGQLNKLADIARFKAHEYLELSDGARAERFALDALRLHGMSGAQLDALSDMILLAELARRDRRIAHALSWVNVAEALGRKLDVAVARGEVALARARIASGGDDPQDVVRTISAGQRDIERLGDATRWEAHALRARALSRLGKFDEAASAGRLAVASIEKTRQRILSGPLRNSYSVSRIGAYADLVTTLLQLHRVDEALEVADAARGRALLEQLSAFNMPVEGNAAQQLTESERLLRRIDWLGRQLQVIDDGPQRDRGSDRSSTAAIQRELVHAQRSYDALLQTASRDTTGDVTLLAAPAGVLPARKLRRTLAGTEALIEYFMAESELVTFVLTSDTLVSFRSAMSASDLATRVHLANNLLRDAGSNIAARNNVLRPLHQLLLEPAIASGLLRDKRSLIVVPHGALVHLPFVALVDNRGRYAGESYDVLTSPSASILATVRSRPATAMNGRHAVFAPLPVQLPGTRAEAEAVAARLPDAQVFIGNGANEVELRKQLVAGGYIHIATHGTLSGTSPMFSHVETAVASSAGLQGDGRFEVHELLGMRVRSELVFLSGCETGAASAWTNAFRRGEDYSTLSQAFLFAGARNVVATLWRIDDEGAALFATAFYDALQASTPMAALATAQRRMMRHPRWSPPRYWAGYTLSGSGQSGRSAK